jgi:hypothetical protein
MELSQQQVDFLEKNHGAAMVTVGDDGTAKAVRIGLAMVDGKLWSSGTAGRVRTRRLARDPRCTLFVFAPRGYAFLTLETTVTILDGPESVDASVRLFRVMQGRPDGPIQWFGRELEEDALRQLMVDEGRVVYDFEPLHAYGLV